MAHRLNDLRVSTRTGALWSAASVFAISNGRWEGETLVVDTTGFNYRRLEKNAQIMEFKCVEFAEELICGQLRKQPNR